MEVGGVICLFGFCRQMGVGRGCSLGLCSVWMWSCGGLGWSSSAQVLIKAHRVPGLQSPMGKRLPKSGTEALLCQQSLAPSIFHI